MRTGYRRSGRRFVGKTFTVRHSSRHFFRYILLLFCSFISLLLFPQAKPCLELISKADFIQQCIHSAFPIFRTGANPSFIPNKFDLINLAVPLIPANEAMVKKYAALWDTSIRAKRSEKKSEDTKTETKQLDNMKVQTISMAAKGLTFNNATEYSIDSATLLSSPLTFGSRENEPRVLIVHTHSTEAYSDSPGGRSMDDNENVVRVGSEIAEKLNKAGIITIHDKTKNDQPDYNGSYKKALSVIQQNLLKHPSIEIVLDIHRDYTVRDAGKPTELHLKPTQTENGKAAAQIMFVMGTDAMDLHHPDWRHNLSFAVKIQNRMNEIHPNLCRPINVRTERFNQHMTKGSMIIEVGSSTNSLEEAIRSGGYIAEAIADVLNDK